MLKLKTTVTIGDEILAASYWEHFKYAKDLALYLERDHPKRVELENEMNDMIEKMNEPKTYTLQNQKTKRNEL